MPDGNANPKAAGRRILFPSRPPLESVDCAHCGHRFTVKASQRQATCPNCQSRLFLFGDEGEPMPVAVLPRTKTMGCPFCQKLTDTKELANHIKSEHPAEAALLGTRRMRFPSCPHIMRCRVCGLPFDLDDHANHVRTEHPEVAIKKRGLGKGLLMATSGCSVRT